MFVLRTIMMLSIISMVMLATISYGHKFEHHKIQRNNYQSLYRPSLFGDDCTEESCMHSVMVRVPAAPSNNGLEFNLSEESNDFVPFIENDYQKRNSDVNGLFQNLPPGVYPLKRLVTYSSPVRGSRNDIGEAMKQLPCTCVVGKIIKDFGAGYYPRYMPVAKCSRTQCDQRIECKEYKFQIVLMKIKEDGDLVDVHMPPLPESVMDTHVYDQVMIPVGCETMY